MQSTTSFYNIEIQNHNNQYLKLSQFQGKYLLIVNVASKCGFTTQYQGLEKLYQDFKPENFEILGFPCNQFLKQEPSSNSEIQQFCQLNYGVSFPIFAKIDVNGKNAHPLYRYLKQEKKGFLCFGCIKWNFTKFLVDPNGKVIRRFSSFTKPEKIAKIIKQIFKK